MLKGNLRPNLKYWEEIGASSTILEILKTGYKLPFISTPRNSYFENNKSALVENNFVLDSIKELLESGRIVESPVVSKIINPLSVSTNSSMKKRLILD